MKRLLAYILKILSKLTIKKYHPLIIGITGSAGKTSAKEAIYAALLAKERTRKTSANFNNELGLPLSILGDWEAIKKPVWLFWFLVLIKSTAQLLFPFAKYPKQLVLEYGSDSPGDIEKLCNIARPDIGIITAIGHIPVHVENYPGGIEDVFREKAKLISALHAGGIAILNADDPLFEKLKEKTRARIVSYGFNEKADVQITNFTHSIKNGRIDGIACKIHSGKHTLLIGVLDAFSVSHAYAIACAVAVGLEREISIQQIAERLHAYKPVDGRSVLLDGIKQTQIIDESYNSSPLALETALKTLRMIEYRRKIAVLGDMLELGNYTLRAHEHAGEIAAQSVDVLITVGTRAKFIAYKAREKGLAQEQVFVCENTDEAGRKLQELMKEGDVVLIKGSRSIGLDKVVEEVREL